MPSPLFLGCSSLEIPSEGRPCQGAPAQLSSAPLEPVGWLPRFSAGSADPPADGSGTRFGVKLSDLPGVREIVAEAVADVRRAGLVSLDEIDCSLRSAIADLEAAVGPFKGSADSFKAGTEPAKDGDGAGDRDAAVAYPWLDMELNASPGERSEDAEVGPDSQNTDKSGESKFTALSRLAEKAHKLHCMRFRKEFVLGDKRSLNTTWAERIVRSSYFSGSMALIITLNALSIGYEINLSLRDETSSMVIIAEHVFLVLYVIELFLTFMAKGAHVLKNGWVRFDAVLIGCGIGTTWILAPILKAGGYDGTEGQEEWMRILQQILILRVLRILRLGRALRLLSRFETLGKLVGGMLSSASTMVSATALILCTIYVLACIGAELIVKSPELQSNPQVQPIIEEYLSDLPNIMLALCQFTTEDSVSVIYRPIIQAQPWLALYFVVVIVMLSFQLMNLVTAIVVEDAISRASKDKELQNARMRRMLAAQRPLIQKLFKSLDKDGSGEIELMEMVESIDVLQQEVPPDLEAVLVPECLVDLFDYLDVNGTGTISEEEFVDGISHLALMQVPVETTQIIQLLRQHRHSLSEMHGNFQNLQQVTKKIEKLERQNHHSIKRFDSSLSVVQKCSTAAKLEAKGSVQDKKAIEALNALRAKSVDQRNGHSGNGVHPVQRVVV